MRQRFTRIPAPPIRWWGHVRLPFRLLALVLPLSPSLASLAQVSPSSTLPILEVRTKDRIEPETGFAPDADLYIYQQANGGPNRLSDQPAQTVSKIYIRTRGASSLGYPKKNFGFEIRDSLTQAEKEVSIFGFPAHEDWALHGPYADKSLIRNALAYSLARTFTPWAPRHQFCEFVLNSSYRGVYLFTERVKRDPNRVDISRLRPTDLDRDDITGGYMLEIGDDPQTEFSSFNSNYSQAPSTFVKTQYQLDYPEFTQLGAGQFSYIQNYVRSVEDLIAQANYTDPQTGYANRVNVSSWVDFAVIQELSGNFDAYRRSTWVVKDRDDNGGRFAAGPAWDFDIAFGGDSVCLGYSVEGWVSQSNGPACDFKTLPFFVQRFWSDPMFRARFRDRWEGLRQNQLSDAEIFGTLDSLVSVVRPAQPNDQARWNHIGMIIGMNAYAGPTYQAEVDYLRNWLRRRLAWIDAEVRTFPRVAELQARNSTLPILRIDVPGNDSIATTHTTARMRAIDNGPGQLNSPDGATTNFNGPIAIELKGAADEKSTYSLELRRDTGEDYPFQLLGLPKEEDWELRGPYSDKTLSRDLLGSALAEASGRYAPRMRPVVLYVNNSYQGIYVLAETVKRDDNRVDIARLDPSSNSGDALTGGYLLEIDGEGNDPERGFTGSPPVDNIGMAAYYRFVEPAAEAISSAQRTYIQTFVRNLEQTLATQGVEAASAQIDQASFIDYLLLQELSGNARAYTHRTFLHKDRSSTNPRLMAGPASDFNRGFGNDQPCGGTSVARWLVEAPGRCDGEKIAAEFWRKLWSDTAFRAQTSARWRALRQNAWSDAALRACVAGFAGRLAPETVANFVRYPILGQQTGRNAFVGQTYADEVTYLENWLIDRARWIDGNIDLLTDTSQAPDRTSLTVSPNPGGLAQEISINYDLGASLEGALEIQVIDAAGRTVATTPAQGAFGRVRLPIDALPQGVFALRLLSANREPVSVLWVR